MLLFSYILEPFKKLVQTDTEISDFSELEPKPEPQFSLSRKPNRNRNRRGSNPRVPWPRGGPSFPTVRIRTSFDTESKSIKRPICFCTVIEIYRQINPNTVYKKYTYIYTQNTAVGRFFWFFSALPRVVLFPRDDDAQFGCDGLRKRFFYFFIPT